jgi:hypothetical protein
MNDPTAVTWNAMRRCGPRRSGAGRQAGTMVSPSSKAGERPPGCAPRAASQRSHLPTERPTITGEVDCDLVGVLAAMALAVVG